MALRSKAFGIREVLAEIPPSPLSSLDEINHLVTDSVIIDLPLPPSVNRLMARLGNKSTVVQRWIRVADAHLMSRPAEWRRIQAGAVKGPFLIHITWDREEFGISDIDNRCKVLLDYLQRICLIENDRLCRAMSVRFGVAPDGCRVRIRPWDWQS